MLSPVLRKYFVLISVIFFVFNSVAQTITKTIDYEMTKVHGIDGVGWATPIATSLKTGNIYFAYIDPQLNAVVAQKTLDGVITTKIVKTNIQNNDNHAELSIAVDNDGYIHFMGGHHNSSPQYYRTDKPEDIRSWTFKGNDLPNGGVEGIAITYQGFYKSNNGTLFVAMRSNLLSSFTTGVRSIALGRYNTASKKWEMLGGTNYAIASGTSPDCLPVLGATNGMKALIWNPSGVGDMRPAANTCASTAHYQGYQLRILFDKNNGMHITYNMADSININYSKSDVSKFMTHVFYAYSPDEGNTWFKANGQQITSLPITKQSGDLVYKKYPDSYLYPAVTDQPTMANANDMFLDANDKPIVMQSVYGANGGLKSFQWDGSKWNDVTSMLSLPNEKCFTGIYRGEIYNFAGSAVLKVSNDNLHGWTDYGSMTENAWYVMIDRYFLQKTGKLRYYARNESNNTAGVQTFSIKGNEAAAGKTVYTISASATNGSVSPSSETYAKGLHALIYATPATGYAFQSWTGDYTGTNNPALVLMDGNKSIVANFVKDEQMPTVPLSVRYENLATSSFHLYWNESSDNDKVAKYEVYFNGELKYQTGDTTLIADQLTPSTEYEIKVRTKDRAGNYSAFSTPITVRTKTAPTTVPGTIAYEPYNYEAGTLNPDPDNGTNGGNGYPASNYTTTGTGFRFSWGNKSLVANEGLKYVDQQGDTLYTFGKALYMENYYGTALPALYIKVSNDPFGNKRVIADGNFGANNTELWFSFLMKNSDITNYARMMFKSADNVILFYAGLSDQKWCLTEYNSSTSVGGVAAENDKTALFLGKITYGNTGISSADDKVELWVNPNLDGTLPVPTSTISNINASLMQFQSRTDLYDTDPQKTIFDEFRFGISREAVAPFSKLTALKTNLITENVSVLSVDGMLKVKAEYPIRSVQLYTADGRLIISHTPTQFSTEATINTNSLSKGFYIAKVRVNEGVVSKAVVVR
jgi:hypothetical protein